MINKIFSNKISSLIVIVMFSYAFVYLVDKALTYENILESGLVGYGFLSRVFSAIELAGDILKNIYNFFTNILQPVFKFIQDFIAWWKRQTSDFDESLLGPPIHEAVRIIKGVLFNANFV